MSASKVEIPAQAPLAAWRAHLADGRLMLQRCADCQRFVFYPRVLCPFCASESLSWERAGERGGVVHAVTVVARKDKDGGPYNVVLVDLDEGVRMMSRVVDQAPDDVRIGQRVMPLIGDLNGEAAVLFRPA